MLFRMQWFCEVSEKKSNVSKLFGKGIPRLNQSVQNGVLSVLSCCQCCPAGLLVQAKILASRWRPSKDEGTRSKGEESECRQVNVPVDTDTLAVGRPVVFFFFWQFRSSTNGSLVLKIGGFEPFLERPTETGVAFGGFDEMGGSVPKRKVIQLQRPTMHVLPQLVQT